MLINNPNLKLSEYCKEFHINYRGVLEWTRYRGIRVTNLRREARGETPVWPSNSYYGDMFIQFAPARHPSTCNLSGVSITFSDGVNLTIQESSVESIISLLTIYQSRQGGAKTCLD